jgi:hypothetical protein
MQNRIIFNSLFAFARFQALRLNQSLFMRSLQPPFCLLANRSYCVKHTRDIIGNFGKVKESTGAGLQSYNLVSRHHKFSGAEMTSKSDNKGMPALQHPHLHQKPSGKSCKRRKRFPLDFDKEHEAGGFHPKAYRARWCLHHQKSVLLRPPRRGTLSQIPGITQRPISACVSESANTKDCNFYHIFKIYVVV